MPDLFTYGSLMCSDIMYHVADCRADFVPAVLENFKRSKMHGQEYPAIIAAPEEITGRVRDRHDQRDGPEYKACPVIKPLTFSCLYAPRCIY